MAGGNPDMLRSILGSMPDRFPVYPMGGGSGSLASLVNSLEDPLAESSFKSQLNQEEEQYKYKLRDWETKNKQEYAAKQAQGLSNLVEQLAQNQGLNPNMSIQQKEFQATMQTLGSVGGLEAAIPVIQDVIKNLSQAQSKNIEQLPGQKYADALGLQGQERAEFIYNHAMKSGAPVVNINNGDGRPSVNVLPNQVKQELGLPENTQYVVDKNGMPQAINTGSIEANKTKQHFDTMSNASKRLDQLAREVPNYNPAEFTDAMIRSLASDDSSLIGKVLSPLQSPASRAYGTAAAEWVSSNRAILSGAEVPEKEFMRDLSIYFAKPGDTPEILAMKAQMRRDRVESLKSIAALPADQRAAAWKATGESDGLKLSGLSTKSPIGNTINSGEERVNSVIEAWETRAGRPATQDEIEKIRNRLRGQ